MRDLIDQIDVLENMDNPTILISFAGEIKGVNQQGEELLNQTSHKLLGTNFLSFFSAVEQEKISRQLNDIRKQGLKKLKDLTLFELSENREKKVDLKFDLMNSIQNNLIKVAIVDTETRQEIERKIEILAEFPENNPNPVLRLSNSGQLLYANSASKELLEQLGIEEDDYVADEYRTIIEEVVETKQSKEIMVQPEEELYLFSFTYYEHYDCVYLYGQDMTGLKQANQHIERLANYDSLSGLPNRNLFLDRLERLILKEEKEELIAVLFIDVDNFKKINDSYCHQAGDKVLTDIAKRLENCVGKEDTVARLSGDQFGIIVSGMEDVANFNQILEGIMQEFNEPFIFYPQPGSSEGKEAYLTISVGVSFYPQDSTGVEQLIKNAEIAMNQVKKSGKNNYRFFSEEMNQSFLNELELEAKLRQALDKEEFVVYYQPQVDIEENETFGLEALLRWNNQELGLVSPGKFIPLAERTGLILDIGNWVLQQACQETKELQEQTGRNLEIAINLSPRQFRDQELVAKVDRALEVSGLDSADLTLEITESMIMDDTQHSVERLIELKERGINISIDDFGTGYSSLSYLSRFPIDELKIDRSFIMDIPADKEKMSIAKAVIDLAYALDLNVIAEGVEEYEQIQFLKENNCRQVQGYYYYKPVPKNNILRFLADKKEVESSEGEVYLAGITYN
ncbi:MAG: sensor domain-containing protein [Bacillota bacterium]